MKIYARTLYSIKEKIKTITKTSYIKEDVIELVQNAIDDLNEQKKKEDLLPIVVSTISRVINVLSEIIGIIKSSDDINISEISIVLDKEIIYIECVGNQELFEFRSNAIKILSKDLNNFFIEYDNRDRYCVKHLHYAMLRNLTYIMEFIDDTINEDKGDIFSKGYFHKLLCNIKEIISTDLFSFLISTKESSKDSDICIRWEYIQNRLRNCLDYTIAYKSFKVQDLK